MNAEDLGHTNSILHAERRVAIQMVILVANGAWLVTLIVRETSGDIARETVNRMAMQQLLPESLGAGAIA